MSDIKRTIMERKNRGNLIILCCLCLFFTNCSMHRHIHDTHVDTSSEAGKPSDSDKLPESKKPPEVELGKKIFEELKQQLKFTDNPLIQAYVNRIGEKILHQVPPNRFDFRYFVIKSDQLNAFALPNGHICFTERLLNSVRSEDELAFVLCHETAHVTQTHFRRLMSKKSKVDIATMAAMVAGILVAKDSEVMTAIQAFSLGTNQTFLLKYSREFENEADGVGFKYFTGAGYQAQGAIDFMRTLQRLERITIVPPAYLSTHPPTDARIYHLQQLNKKKKASPSKMQSIGNFRRFQIWNRIETEYPQDYLQDLQQDYKNNPQNPDVLYGLAMVYEKLGNTEESIDFFQKCLTLNPYDDDALRDFGIFLFRRNKYAEAEKYLEQATKIDLGGFLAFHYLGRSQYKKGQLEKAIANLTQSKKLEPSFPENYYFLGLIYQQKGQLKKAHKNFGEHFFLKGNKKAAEFHFKEAKRLNPNPA